MNANSSRRCFRSQLERLERRDLLAVTVSGNITADAHWQAALGPYTVTQDITINAGATLTIEPGTIVQFNTNARLTVRGRIVAEGTAENHIALRLAPGQSGKWDGLEFRDSLVDNRLVYVDMSDGQAQGEAIDIQRSQVLIDHVVWTGTNDTVLELTNPSLIVRNSSFPGSTMGETIHGNNIVGAEYFILDGNTFGYGNNQGDVIDFTGASRPGPVFQVLNNVFLGGDDDGLDLDGTDAHIEGNVFMNFNLVSTRPTTSNAIATGDNGGVTTEIVVVRNIFIDNDHAILLKENASAIVENNTFIGMSEAVIQFTEVDGSSVDGPGIGARLDGNIFWNNAQLFKNLIDDGSFMSEITVNRSLLPNDMVDFDGTPVMSHDFGVGNIAGDPMFVDEAGGDYQLLAGSPAMGTGPNGIDMGAFVPAGPSLSGVPTGPISSNQLSLSVAGPSVVSYRWRLDDGPLSGETPVDDLIELTELTDGQHTLEILGRNDADVVYPSYFASFTIDQQAPKIVARAVVLNESPQSIAFTFEEAVEVEAADLQLVNQTTSQPIDPLLALVVFDAETNVATWTFPGFPHGVLPYGDYSAMLVAAGVADPAGNALDENGLATATFSWLRGDVDGDESVDAADLDALFAAFDPSESNPIVDLTGDGAVDALDVDELAMIIDTLRGDATLDGQVSRRDLARLAAHFGQSGGWTSGSFDGANRVDLSDLAIVGQNWNSAASAPAVAASASSAPLSAARKGRETSARVRRVIERAVIDEASTPIRFNGDARPIRRRLV